MDYLAGIAGSVKGTVLNMAWIFIVLWGIERLWPRDRPSEKIQLASLRFWAIAVVAGAVLSSWFAMVKPSLGPLTVINVEQHMPRWLAYVVGPLATIAMYDFLNYWMHRAQHKWFWKQHSVHHSIRDLSAVNSYFHWTEELFRVAFIAVPSAILFDLDIGGATLVSAMLSIAHGNFIHSASSWHFGKTGRLLLADNRWHRIHHSIEPEHFDKNFGTAVTFWDRLFGTAYFPENDEWPAVGVHDMAEIKSVDEYLWRPFRQLRGKGAAGGVKPLSEA